MESSSSSLLSSKDTTPFEVTDLSSVKIESNNGSRSSSPEAKQTPTPTKAKPNKRPTPRKPRLPKRHRDRDVNDVLDLTQFVGEDGNYSIEHIDPETKQDLALLHHVFCHSRRLIIVTGAGISVAAGIPDFRSTKGLFATLKNDLKLKTTGKAMFDASVYKDTDSTLNFHTTVQNLHKLCSEAKPTKFHEYMDQIASEGRLTRLYTQNIDCLDSSLPNLGTKIPIPLNAPWPKTIQLHGTLDKMVCSKCGWLSDLKPEIFDNGDTPECPECAELDSVRAIAGKRLQGIGKLRPRLVLYNEGNPDAEAIGSVSETDLLSKPDGLVVVGTSMKIPGVKRIVREMSQAVHASKGACVWMNMDDVQLGKDFENVFDLYVQGDCQVVPGLLRDYELEMKEANIKKEEAKRVRREKSLAKKRTKEQNTAITDTFKVSKDTPVAIKKEHSNKPLRIDQLLNSTSQSQQQQQQQPPHEVKVVDY